VGQREQKKLGVDIDPELLDEGRVVSVLADHVLSDP
jgi:hypothetical protein